LSDHGENYFEKAGEMNDTDMMIEAMVRTEARRRERRAFLSQSGALVATAAGASLLTGCFGGNDNDNGGGGDNVIVTPTQPISAPPSSGPLNDFDILNFALQLEYLEAQFYSFAAFGAGLPGSALTGSGIQGNVIGGRQVNFSDTLVGQYAREIANDERAHVAFLRSALAGSAVAQPTIDIDVTPTSAFSNAARAAGLIGPGQAFDVYANDNNFLLGAFIFEDVGVTAYKGAAPLVTSKALVEASAGILAAEAYHAGLIRTVLFAKGIQTPSLIQGTEAISNARDSLDGPSDIDQGVAPRTGPFGTESNIVPGDANGIAFSRTAGQVLNIVFLTKQAAVMGGFFPNGLNGKIQTSAAN
jgi:hypothetical protein